LHSSGNVLTKSYSIPAVHLSEHKTRFHSSLLKSSATPARARTPAASANNLQLYDLQVVTAIRFSRTIFFSRFVPGAVFHAPLRAFQRLHAVHEPGVGTRTLPQTLQCFISRHNLCSSSSVESNRARTYSSNSLVALDHLKSSRAAKAA
jgi:hypothetical protein